MKKIRFELTGETVPKAITAAMAPITLSRSVKGLVECVSVSSASSQVHAGSSSGLLGEHGLLVAA
jgi:hypothetical protein